MTRMISSRAERSIAYAEGWLVSLSVHALIVWASVLTLSELSLAPAGEPFRWNISIVGTTPGKPADTSPTAAPSQPTPVPPASKETRRPPLTPPVRPHQVKDTTVQTVRPAEVATAVSAPPPPPVPQPLVEEPVREPAVHETPSEPEPTPAAPARQTHPAVVEPHPAPAENPVSAPAASEHQAEPASLAAAEATAAPDHPSRDSRPVPALQGAKADYGWLARAMWDKVAALKRYPHRARLNHWEGKVVLMAVIREDGHLARVTIKESSGYAVLDDDALELIRKACPLALPQPLGRPEIVVQVPVSYTLTQFR
jgi:protein TonB